MSWTHAIPNCAAYLVLLRCGLTSYHSSAASCSIPNSRTHNSLQKMIFVGITHRVLGLYDNVRVPTCPNSAAWSNSGGATKDDHLLALGHELWVFLLGKQFARSKPEGRAVDAVVGSGVLASKQAPMRQGKRVRKCLFLPSTTSNCMH